jgi:RNA polymerase sigma-70 factor, ECF subfamily
MSNAGEPHREDLELARACAAGVASAREAFERDHLAAVAEHAAVIDRSPEFALRVRTALAAELFEAGRIREYTGDAPLSAWIRVAALRRALALRPAPSGLSRPTQVGTDEVQLPRDADKTAVAQALQEATTRDRMVLRFMLVERMDPGRVGAIYGVPAATVRHWVTEALERIRDRTAGAIDAVTLNVLLVRLLRGD